MAELPTRSPRVRSASRSSAWVALPVLGGAGLVVLAVLLSLGSASETGGPSSAASQRPERFPNEWPSPPPAEVAALLGGLGPGSPLGGGWRVRGISPVLERRIVVDVERDEAGFRIWVMLHDRESRLPPRKTARFSLFTAQPRPSADALSDQDYDQVLDALAERIRVSEGRVQLPRGL